MPKNRFSNERGFSLVEVLVVLGATLVVSAIAIPNFISAVRTARLRGAVSDFASLVQIQRIKAVDDDLYYSSYVLGANPQVGFVDIYPQQTVGASGSGGTQVDPKDPIVQINPEIVQKAVGGAPNTASLKGQFLPANATVVLGDGSVAASAITFGPRGLPCAVSALTCKTHLPAGDIAYWIFFQDSNSMNWGAVTVTPAGRVQRWLFTGGANGTWAKF